MMVKNWLLGGDIGGIVRYALLDPRWKVGEDCGEAV
jgi:hypothetical protein